MILFPILFYLLFVIINLRLAAFVLIILLPGYLLRFSLGPTPTTFLEAMIFCLTIIWLIKTFKDKKIKTSWQNVEDLLGKNILIIIALFILSATIAIFVASDTKAALGIWKAYFIEPIILFYIFLNIFSKRDIPKIIFSLGISALIVSGLAVVQKFTGWFVPYTFWGKDNTFRVTSFYGYPNAIGLYLAPIIPLIIFQLRQFFKTPYFVIPDRLVPQPCGNGSGIQVNKTRSILLVFFYLLTVICILLSVLWANSTGALVALAIGLVFTGLFNKKTLPLAFFLLFLGTGLLSFNLLPQNIIDVLLLKDWSGQVRIKMWAETTTMLKNNFIFGAGLSGYQIVVAPYHLWSFVEIFQYPHNFILTFWSEIGLLGLLSFLALSFIYLKKIINNLKNNFNPWLFYGLLWSFLVILIHGLVDVPYFKNDLAILFWIIISLFFINNKVQNEFKQK